MGERLRAELKQNKPFSSPAEEAILNIERTADCFRRECQRSLKPFGITPTQFNALRILRGALPDGLTCSELGKRLVNSDPDITRLLERLARQGMITRRRGSCDKRMVVTVIHAKGMALLAELDPVMERLTREILGHMRADSIHMLIDLLEEARAPFTADSCRNARMDTEVA